MHTHKPTNALNLASLVTAVAAQTGLSHAQAREAVQSMMDVVVRTVAAGHAVTLTNFGTWTPVDNPARVRRNPATGEQVEVGPRRVIRWRPSGKAVSIVAVCDPHGNRRKSSSRGTRR